MTAESEPAAVTVANYPMGSDVPEWLLAVTPGGPTSHMGKVRFAVDVDVIETPNYFLVAPTSLAPVLPYPLDTEGTSGCNIAAASKLVKFSIYQQSFLPAEISAKIVGAALGYAPSGIGATPAAAVNTPPAGAWSANPAPPPPRPTFWQKLRGLFAP